MKLIKPILLLLIFVMTNMNAQFEFAGDVKNYKQFENRIEFDLSNSKFNLYVYQYNIIRFRFTNKNEFDPAPSYAVIYELPGKTNFSFKEEENHFLVTTGELNIQINKSPCRISIYDKDMNLINADEESFGVSFDSEEVRVHKKLLEGENFFGLGEKSDNLKKNGNQYTMWNTDYPAYTSRKDPLYVSIPFFIGVKDFKGYGIFFDNTYKSYFNMGASNDRFYWFGADKGEMDYYFIYGPEIKKVVSDYTLLTGRMQMPPKWALGYQQSRWSYYPESKVREIAKNFRDYDIPCDVIYLDIHYMDGYRVFTWDKERFPQPEKMISDLKKDGFKLITIIDPGVKADENYHAAKEGIAKDLFAKYPDGQYYQGEVWPSWAYFPDFTKKETREWWGDKLSVLMNEGIEGFWNDMNEPAVWGQNFPDIVQFDDNGFKASHKKIHNVYGLAMAQATNEGLQKHSSDKRRFVLTRAAFAGIQRYSAVWTGDNEATEEHLKLSCVMPQGLGLSGVAFNGPDAGGFMGEPSAKLYARWYQLGSFTPFFRGHTEINTKAQEPWAFPEWVTDIARASIKFRYQLLPFWYSEFYYASKTGMPVMRPMFLNNQSDKNCYLNEIQEQFMLGDNLLVAPVLNENDLFKKLYLPEGTWFEWNSNPPGRIIEGGSWIVVEAPRNNIPLYLKEGGIIPMHESQNYVGEKQIRQMEFLIFPSEKYNDYNLYEDDGETFKYTNGNYSLTNINAVKNSGKIIIKLDKTYKGYDSKLVNYLFQMINIDSFNSVKVNGILFKSIKDKNKFDESNESFFYNKSDKFLIIKTPVMDNIYVEIQ
ncbi:MAG: glycoside hydrolase family 31 protein [Bacteroidetes bacterium]|nr:glycoside hydrolase family 31 protein [Bacteroidota bacterium]